MKERPISCGACDPAGSSQAGRIRAAALTRQRRLGLRRGSRSRTLAWRVSDNGGKQSVRPGAQERSPLIEVSHPVSIRKSLACEPFRSPGKFTYSERALFHPGGGPSRRQLGPDLTPVNSAASRRVREGRLW